MGAVLLQKYSNKCKSGASASRSTSETECHYVQIKRGISDNTNIQITFFLFETDHKPLVSLLGIKA